MLSYMSSHRNHNSGSNTVCCHSRGMQPKACRCSLRDWPASEALLDGGRGWDVGLLGGGPFEAASPVRPAIFSTNSSSAASGETVGIVFDGGEVLLSFLCSCFV